MREKRSKILKRKLTLCLVLVLEARKRWSIMGLRRGKNEVTVKTLKRSAKTWKSYKINVTLRSNWQLASKSVLGFYCSIDTAPEMSVHEAKSRAHFKAI